MLSKNNGKYTDRDSESPSQSITTSLTYSPINNHHAVSILYHTITPSLLPLSWAHPNPTLSLGSSRYPFRPVPKNILSDFPRTRLGQFRHHLHLPRKHELADLTLVPGPVNHLFPLQAPTLLRGYKRLGSLSPMCVRHRHHAHLQNVRVSHQHGFQCDRRDVFASCTTLACTAQTPTKATTVVRVSSYR